MLKITKILTTILGITLIPQVSPAFTLCDVGSQSLEAMVKVMPNGVKQRDFVGEQAAIVRKLLIESQGQGILEFDRVTFFVKLDKVWGMLSMNGCVVGGGPMPVELYKMIVAEVERV